MRRAVVARAAVVLLLAPAAACVHTDHMRVDTQACVKQGVPVEVFMEVPARPHRPVAIIDAVKDTWWSYASWEDLRLALCAEAAQLGADAIVHPSVEGDPYSVTVGMLGLGGNATKLVAVAIEWTGPPPAKPAPGAAP